MAINIKWTPEAELTFDNIVEYLEKEWSEKEVKKFFARVNHMLILISQNPKIYKASKTNDVRIGVITKHNSLVYRIKSNEIELLTFWANRQDPEKLKY